MIISPTRLDKLQEGLYTVLQGRLSPVQVGWAYGQGAFESMPTDLLNLTVSTGPTPFSRKGARGTTFLPYTSITLQVTGSTEGVKTIVTLNEYDFAYEALLGDTIEIVRDNLLLTLNSNPENDPWTAAALDLDKIVITPNAFADVWETSLHGEIQAIEQVVPGTVALKTVGTRTFTINLQAFSKARSPRSGAWRIMDKVLTVFEDPVLNEDLYAYGIAVWDKGTPTDISAIAGANWESRVSVDVDIAMRSVATRSVDHIETLNLGLGFSDPQTLIESTTIVVSNS